MNALCKQRLFMHRNLRFFDIFLLIRQGVLSTMPGYAKASKPLIPYRGHRLLGVGRRVRESGLGRLRGFGPDAVQCGGCVDRRAGGFRAFRIGSTLSGDLEHRFSARRWRSVSSPWRGGQPAPRGCWPCRRPRPGSDPVLLWWPDQRIPERCTGCPSVYY